MEFDRSSRKSVSTITLTSLIDVTFVLIIFFMLSTTFTKTDSLELALPMLGGKNPSEQSKQMVKIYVADDGGIYLGDDLNPMDDEALFGYMKETITKTPDKHIFVFSSPLIPVQKLVGVMDVVYMAGGRNLSVAEWKMLGTTTPPVITPEAQP